MVPLTVQLNDIIRTEHLVGHRRLNRIMLKNHEKEGAWYMDVPVSNVFRSTRKLGKIHISVASSGLASRSIDDI